MKRKKGGGGGGANWMDTYGDMVTLLLCFFVLLYSMSTISEENWKALVMSFNPDADQTIRETSGNEGPNADPSDETESSGMMEISQADIDTQMEELYQALQAYAAEEGMKEKISVTKGDGQIFVAFDQTAFFSPNSFTLLDQSMPILDSISAMLTGSKDAIQEVRIQGHTAQDVPDSPNDPRVDRFLSSNRATNVLVYIQTHSEIDPARLVSEGMGQWRPVGDNDTSEGRAKNRRVEMIISARDLESELGDSVQQYTTGNQN